MKYKESLHDIRKANNKIKLLNITIKYLKKLNFEEINVNSVCQEAEISKVTYYNYFPNKGDILLFYMSIWCYQLEIDIINESLKGTKAIYRAFENIISLDNNQTIIIGLIGFIANLKEKPTKMKLTYIEKIKLFPSLEESSYSIEEHTIDEILLKHLELAISTNQIKDQKIEHTLSQLIAAFYGVPFSLYLQNHFDLKENYFSIIKKILGTQP